MPIATESTTFTKDVLGRYICNTMGRSDCRPGGNRCGGSWRGKCIYGVAPAAQWAANVASLDGPELETAIRIHTKFPRVEDTLPSP